MLSLELLLEVLSLLLLLMRTSHYQHRRSGGKSNGQLAINVQLGQLTRFVLFRIKINKRINRQCAKKSLDRTNCAHDIFHCQQINERPWYITRSLNISARWRFSHDRSYRRWNCQWLIALIVNAPIGGWPMVNLQCTRDSIEIEKICSTTQTIKHGWTFLRMTGSTCNYLIDLIWKYSSSSSSP